MTNEKIVRILKEIAIFLEMKDIQFKPRAYEKAAEAIESLDKNVEEIYKEQGIKGLKEIPAVGEGIAERIEELIKHKKIKHYEKLKKEIPINIEQLNAIEGMGPKMTMKLYKELNVKNIKDLEKAAKQKKIRNLEDFGGKTEKNILKSIQFYKKSQERFLLSTAISEARKIEERIKKQKGVKKIITAGSIRRKKETIGDGDLLVTTSSKKAAKDIMEFFTNMPDVVQIINKGETKSSIKLENNMNFDLRVVSAKSFGSALLYFTGSKAHNIALRKIAISKGYKLNEYGLIKNKKTVASKTEEEIYKKLKLQYMPPELREDKGEIEAAQENKLPKLINYDDLKGDLQTQTTWSDGSSTIEEYAQEGIKMNLEYILITDHTQGLAMTGGLDEKRLKQQAKEIEKINEKYKNKIKILKGAEVNIKKDGTLDIKDSALKQLDIVGIAVHSGFKMSKKEMTDRIIKAMKNPNAHILFHPTGRIIHKRPAYELDMEKIIRAAKETNTILEIDAFPSRLDLKDEYIRMAKDKGIKFSIDTDAHSATQLKYLEYGIAQARRGWAEKKDIINAWPLNKLMKMIK
ncbi:MAG: DNA polymerase/3'-5' exonuclease PolX [Candidatus Portnoybacteria bacterium]|nr:DNA polymerase/3'-5' exonuclease PolX [Candidatus Portnoybacteria bacterium]